MKLANLFRNASRTERVASTGSSRRYTLPEKSPDWKTSGHSSRFTVPTSLRMALLAIAPMKRPNSPGDHMN